MSPDNLLDLLRPDTVTVRCCHRPWTLTAATAHDWIGAVAMDFDTLTGVMPGLVADTDIQAMEQLMWQLDIHTRWMYSARVALTRGGGRDWWWTLNLVKKTVSSWPYINGLLLINGVDAHALRFPDWLDAAYMLLWDRADEKQRISLDMELQLPPVTDVSAPPAAVKAMLAAFAAD